MFQKLTEQVAACKYQFGFFLPNLEKKRQLLSCRVFTLQALPQGPANTVIVLQPAQRQTFGQFRSLPLRWFPGSKRNACIP
jgi:hypothetical protein